MKQSHEPDPEPDPDPYPEPDPDPYPDPDPFIAGPEPGIDDPDPLIVGGPEPTPVFISPEPEPAIDIYDPEPLTGEPELLLDDDIYTDTGHAVIEESAYSAPDVMVTAEPAPADSGMMISDDLQGASEIIDIIDEPDTTSFTDMADDSAFDTDIIDA